MCKIHHPADDSNLLGIDPDRTVHSNRELLTEINVPVLKQGFQEMHGTRLRLPRQRRMYPDRLFLEERFTEFLEAQ